MDQVKGGVRTGSWIFQLEVMGDLEKFQWSGGGSMTGECSQDNGRGRTEDRKNRKFFQFSSVGFREIGGSWRGKCD